MFQLRCIAIVESERDGSAVTCPIQHPHAAFDESARMVKDEDVCLHCGLCAERCPTGAWDMQKFLLEMTHAGPDCRRPQKKAA